MGRLTPSDESRQEPGDSISTEVATSPVLDEREALIAELTSENTLLKQKLEAAAIAIRTDRLQLALEVLTQ